MAKVTTWQIDASHSSVEFTITHMMFTTVRSRFKKLTGTILVNEENPDRSAVEAEIDASSIDTGTPECDQHLLPESLRNVRRFFRRHERIGPLASHVPTCRPPQHPERPKT
jgi:polyisoprenoid-binding protein YceI